MRWYLGTRLGRRSRGPARPESGWSPSRHLPCARRCGKCRSRESRSRRRVAPDLVVRWTCGLPDPWPRGRRTQESSWSWCDENRSRVNRLRSPPDAIHTHAERDAPFLMGGTPQSRLIVVATSARLPSGSDNVHQAGAYLSVTRRPPAAIAAAIRAWAWSGGTQMSRWIRLTCGSGASIFWNQMAAPRPRGSNQVLGAVFAVLVRKHGPPKRLHLGDVKRIDRDEDRLHCRGVGGAGQLARDRRDLSGQFEVTLAQSVVVGRDRDQPHDHAVVPQADIRVVGIEARQPADCLHAAGACRERPGAEVRARSFAHHTPILDALGLVEPPRCDPVAHALNVTRWMREWTHAIRPFTGQGSSYIDMA